MTTEELEILLDVHRAKVGIYNAQMDALIHKDYLVQGRSRFGAYVKITSKGIERLNKTGSGAGETPRGAAPRISRVAARQVGDAVKGVLQSSPQPSATPLQAGATTSRSPPAPPAAVANTPGRRRPVRRGKAGGSETPASATIEANAVRVTIGKRVWYYPISSYDKLAHASKERVRTNNAVYRSYPVGASDQDHIIR